LSPGYDWFAHSAMALVFWLCNVLLLGWSFHNFFVPHLLKRQAPDKKEKHTGSRFLILHCTFFGHYLERTSFLNHCDSLFGQKGHLYFHLSSKVLIMSQFKFEIFCCGDVGLPNVLEVDGYLAQKNVSERKLE
jgi:hypothetical protein